MKVIAYARVSTEEQSQNGVSLAAQEAKLRSYAALYDLELVEVVLDAGASAKTLNRPGLQRALAALESGEAEGLLVAKLDRLTRSVRDLGSLLDSHFKTRFSLFSVADQVDTRTAAGRLVLNLLTSVAEWERECIGERTSQALQHLKAEGRHVGAPGLGQRMEAGELVANPEESATVARILELRQAEKTLREIAATLTAEGRRTKRGGKWGPETVRQVLARVGAA